MLTVGAATSGLLLVEGCGRIGFDPDDAATVMDGAAEDGRIDAAGDAAPDARDAAVTLPTTAFGTPQRLDLLSSPEGDDDPTLTADMLEIYFESDRMTGAGNIWVARRDSITAPWSAPELVTELSSDRGETSPNVSGDGLTIWLGSQRDSMNPGAIGGDHNIYVATRPDRSSPWSTPVIVPELNSIYLDAPGSLSADGLSLVLHSRRRPSEIPDIFMATRATLESPWDVAFRDDLSSDRRDISPFLWGRGHVVFFTANLPETVGRLDIWQAERPTLADPFGPAEPVPGINTPLDEEDTWLSPDGRTIFFASAPDGDNDLFMATR